MPIKASDLVADQPFMHVAVTGPSGSGKTSWSAIAPRPWILTSEKNAIQSIQHANPDALITEISSWRKFDRCLSAVIAGEPITYPDGQRGLRVQLVENKVVETFDFQTLVIDSMTAMSDYLILHMQGGGKAVNRIGDPDSDEYDLTLQQRGRIGETMESVFREQREFRCNTVFQFLPDVRDDNEDMRAVYPLVTGKKTGPKIVSYFNGAAWIECSAQADGSSVHTITWNRRGNYPTKLPPGFPPGKFAIPPGRGGYGLGAFTKAAHSAMSTPTAEWDNVAEIAALVSGEKTVDGNGPAKVEKNEETGGRRARSRRGE